MSKKKRPKYNPAESMRPATLDPLSERLAKELFELACCGSRDLWPEAIANGGFENNPKLRAAYIELTHKGMRDAQSMIIEHLTKPSTLSDSDKIILTHTANSMAWPMIGSQLCYARQLYKEHPVQDINKTNLDSVLLTVDEFHRNDPNCFALISDLTSFVQVGDLLVVHPEKGLSVIEVKEGEINKKLHDFLQFYNDPDCPRAAQHFMENEDENTQKQLLRMIRQINRMSHVETLMRTGKSKDPDNDYFNYIPEEFIEVGTWEKDLLHLIEKSEEKGYAIDVIDDCLFLGCYSDKLFKAAGYLVFNGWFDHCGGTPNSPRFSVLDSLGAPLAEPLFNRKMPEKYKFDIMFGRKHVCMAFSLENFIEKCRDAGIFVRLGTNKETSKIEQMHGKLELKHMGKAVFLSDNGEREFALMDGIIIRIMLHSQRPIQLVKALLEDLN